MKKRLLFDKCKELKYISHLDNMRLIMRLFKIADINIKHSQGYHPKPKLSFGYPPSLGMEIYNEPMDFFLEDEISNKEVMDKLNEIAPKGFKVRDVFDITNKNSIHKDYNSMKYEITFFEKSLEKEFLNLLDQEEIIHVKRKKGKIKKRDIKSRIQKVENPEDIDNKIYLYLEAISPKRFFEILEAEKGYEITRLNYSKVEDESKN
ncbi:MAG: TIGR03936 family radical SAM-associated protein [Fusobacteriota bacterium]